MVWGWEWSPEKPIKHWQKYLNGQIYYILSKSAGEYSSYTFLCAEKKEGEDEEEWKIRKNKVKVNLAI